MGNTMIFPGNRSVTDVTATNYNFETGDFTLQCWMTTVDFGPLFTQPATHLSVAVDPKGFLQFTVKFDNHLQTIESEQRGFNDGNWHHVTAVRSGNELALYANGKKLEVRQHWTNMEVSGSDESAQQFIGHLGQIAIWDKALPASQVLDTFLEPKEGQVEGLLKSYSFDQGNQETLPKPSVSVDITLSNTTNEPLARQPREGGNVFYYQFPQTIAANSKITIRLSNQGIPLGTPIQCTVDYKNSLGRVEIEVFKDLGQYSSDLTAAPSGDLTDELNILSTTPEKLMAELIVAESLVLVMMRNFYNFLNGIKGKIQPDQVKTGGGDMYNLVDYNKACQIFNLYFELKPLAIVYCESTEQVQLVYKKAIENNLPIRVRSGGHDHEGECMGTDAIVIDMTRINHVKLVKPEGPFGPTYAHIGPGIRFISLTTALAEMDVMIPHGTCATVGIAGFTMGGGWGPWTRKAGMCCESLMGATIVRGDGTVVELKAENGQVPDLLWALRGGGGMSYGIVTELVIKTFPLPAELIKFEVEWNKFAVKNDTLVFAADTKVPTLNILKAWENVILSSSTEKLIGTNLKVSAKNWEHDNYDKFDEKTVYHNSIMYGYWEGNQQTLEAFIAKEFSSVPLYELRIDGFGGDTSSYGSNLMSKWDRESYVNVQRMMAGLEGKPLPPDLDAPAPHKITSRLVNKGGLKDAGYRGLLMSLTSPLVSVANRGLGLFSYITLGALSGKYYQNITAKQKQDSAFPYKESQYTIQYQTWWNETLAEKEEWQNNDVYKHTNRALDWMQVCRDFDIPNTSGAFISFKDSSIPTSTYFGASYQKLVSIKEQYSKDPKNHFRTRKTII